MLRDFVYHPNETELHSVLSHFDIDLNQQSSIGLISFLLITPDSFLWKVRINRIVYYLYAEDHTTSLSDVETVISKMAHNDVILEFIHPKQPKIIEATSSYKLATVYNKSKEINDVMEYAVDSGHDLVFLCKSDEDGDDAYFNLY